jgi:hypothetical protein
MAARAVADPLRLSDWLDRNSRFYSPEAVERRSKVDAVTRQRMRPWYRANGKPESFRESLEWSSRETVEIVRTRRAVNARVRAEELIRRARGLTVPTGTQGARRVARRPRSIRRTRTTGTRAGPSARRRDGEHLADRASA